MEQARQAVEAFMARNGRHDTTVHETVDPAVTHELVTKVEQRNVTRAVDREVHQDHYHTSVQPITHQEHREDQHHEETQPVDVQNFEHDDPAETAHRLAEADAEHHDTREEVVAERTTTELPTIEGLHIHHHVHERIQPVIQKQTYETHVYHVVVPIREIHHNAAQHHPSSPLPAVTLDQFKQSGGSLTGREERYDAFEGEPRSVGRALGGKTSAVPTASGPADISASAAVAAPPVGAPRVATFAIPDPVAAEPETQPVPTTIASRTATNSSLFRAPTRAPTAPVIPAREPTSFPSLTRAPTSPAQLAPEPTALPPFVPEPAFASLTRTPTAPSVLTREPTLPAALAREPTAPASLPREPTFPAPLTQEPAVSAPPQRAPTAPATQHESTALTRQATSIAPNHPLMRPPTLLPQDAYREGRGRAETAGRPPHRPTRSRPATSRPGSPP
ncbi:hypothetical protein Slin15195_G107220 [Septoria linicola]|uniref:Uncharacterized protein n=1 Tax=Septoria linicola TaxID=215465 RepID=A0A9Q9B4L8_9PEZI|nr:hypothetical protein Slin14017_G070170 [Septoria linicola]USW57403.1 hypothetical protein Slin15195_G107220 [Septoria linicola]